MGAELLNQDEIDALLRGVDEGAVPVQGAAAAAAAASGEVRNFDLATQAALARSRMPTLDLINDRLTRLLRTSLYNLIRRAPQITLLPVRVQRFNEYLQALQLPASIHRVRIDPLHGSSLFLFTPKLVHALVDNFFGGSGRHAKIEGREFTHAENRVVQLVLRQAMADMQTAWAPVSALRLEHLGTESNPNFVNIVAPGDAVVVSGFHIELDGGGGDLHITIPYAALEPVRELLDSGPRSEGAVRDESWTQTLREELEDAEVEITPLLGRARVSVGQLVDLRPGDVIPCDFDGQVTLFAEGVPVLRGSFGASRGQQAVKITQATTRRPAMVGHHKQ